MTRFLDIIFSFIALTLLSPLLLCVAVALRFTGEGEVFFRQSRVGREGGEFELLKFATMLKNSPNIGTGTVTVKDDPRVLPVGKILRRSKINELPQLINVLVGDMSLIGPRPQTRRCFDAFPDDYHDTILSVRPGLSGLGSIVFRDEEEMMSNNIDADRLYDDVIMPYKGALECWYVKHAGVVTYLKLILLTTWVVLTPKSVAIHTFFKHLPQPPEALSGHILITR